ncbi:MAG: MBL fold metallo-hydrolase [Promethearchaeota archaeon]
MLNWTQLSKGIYLVKECTFRTNRINSLLIEDGKENRVILIDANYPTRDIDELYNRINPPALAFFASHCHLDHIANAYYHQKRGTPIFCPIQEESFIKSLDALIENVGILKIGLKDKYLKMVKKYIKFKECEHVNTFNPGLESFEYDTVNIETIHVPGHSPGHSAFLIKPKREDQNRKILFVSDIGSHPYYGDICSNLKQYRQSIDKLETLYFSDDYILVPAHGNIYLEKDKNFFNRIRAKINSNGTKILNAISKTTLKTIKELVLDKVLNPQKKFIPMIKELYLFWDGGMIFHHLNEFIEQGLVEKIEEIDFLNDKYIRKE